MSTKIPVSSIPELMQIWDWESNTISPEDLGKGSDQKVWWICPNGHEHYQQSPRQKNSKSRGCPKCNILKRARNRTAELIREKGSVVKTHPDMVMDWDYDKNEDSPETVLAGSHTKFWWRCNQCGKSYLMSPNMRSSRGRNCPECGIASRGKSKRDNLLGKYGAVSETHPMIANEWDYTRNTDTPSDVHKGMPNKRWWICEYGHPPYQQSIRDRVRRGYGCPQCQGENQTSFPEQAIFYYIKQTYPDAQNRYANDGFEIDIYIPSLKTGIEYDGLFWHKDKQAREEEKDTFFAKQGIRIIRVKEVKGNIPAEKKDIVWVKATSDYKYLNTVIEDIAFLLGTTIADIDITRDTQTIWNKYLSIKAENSLRGKFPQIAKDWDYSRNIITPEKVSPYSNKKVYWICPECGNSYQMVIGDRTGTKKCGCPKCGFKRRNDMQARTKEKNKQLVSEYRRNNPQDSIAECSRAIGLSYPTVKKYWVSSDE